MILDKIENLNLYKGLSARLTKALGILTDTDILQKPDGRYEVDGDNIFYMVQRYHSKPFDQGKLERHRKYIDIQFVAEGCEVIGYTPVDSLDVSEEYNADKDVAFHETSDTITQLKLDSGMFCVLFADDAHMPCRYIDSPCNVKKIVIKVKIDSDD